MTPLVLSLTLGHVLSLTGETSYRQPESGLTDWHCAKIWLLNYANTESFGFLLTHSNAAPAVDKFNPATVSVGERPIIRFPTLQAEERTMQIGLAGRAHEQARDQNTHVELTWIEKKCENWIRFGCQVGDRIIDRRRRVVSFAPDSVFAFVRWQSNDYGTVRSHIDIVRAVERGEACSTLPFVQPGGELLLHIHGWPKVERVFKLIDAIEKSAIDPCDVSPDHWRHVHNRLAVAEAPRSYSLARHRAWQLRKGLLA